MVQQFTLEELMELAAEKVPGFDKAFFMDNLSRFGRFTPEDLSVSDEEYRRLQMTIETWRRQLPQILDLPERGLGLDR